MSRSVSHLPPMKRIVEVEFLGGNFKAASFIRQHAKKIVVADLELRDLIDYDEVIMAPVHGKVACTYPTAPIRVIEVAASSARFWQLACILERQVRGITDPQLNPLRVPNIDVAYFPMHFSILASPSMLRPERTIIPWVIEIRREVGHMRLFKRHIAEVTAEPGTLILENVTA